MAVFVLKAVSVLVAAVAAMGRVGVYGDICDSRPCQSVNHVCKSLTESDYECVCRDGCTGNDCTECAELGGDKRTACEPNPCMRDCRCVPSCQHSGGYYCRSNSGFLGKNCSVPVPSLRCEPDKMILSVSEDFVKEYDMGLRNSFVSVAPSLHQHSRFCEIDTPTNGVYEMVIPMPFDACGTTFDDTGDSVVFSNQMWFNRHLTNALFDMPIPAAQFKCSYNRVYTVVTSLKPVVSLPNVVSSKKDILPTISLCKVPSCPAVCPPLFRVSGGAAYTVGEMIHVTMSLDSGSSYTTGVAEMYLSCSRDMSSPRLADIVEDGCRADSDLPSMIRSTFSSHIVCVSFQTPRFRHCSEFFIHAELQTCAGGGTEMCPGSRSRRCRSTRSKRSTLPVIVLGPLIVLNGSSGESSVTINGMEDFSVGDLSDVIKGKAANMEIDDLFNVNEGAAIPLENGIDGAVMVIIMICVAVVALMIVLLLVLAYRRSICD